MVHAEQKLKMGEYLTYFKIFNMYYKIIENRKHFSYNNQDRLPCQAVLMGHKHILAKLFEIFF